GDSQLSRFCLSQRSCTKIQNHASSLPCHFSFRIGEAIISETPINFDLIFKNLKDLNVLAGEGVSQIKHTTGGARLKRLDSVPITFYQNGIVMFKGPFRSYEEPSTKHCLRDIMDGFFPSELQSRYPNGVPFQVHLYNVFFQERKLPGYFPGFGQAVGRSKPSGPKLTMEEFLNKLPKSLVRDGQVIDIREDLKKTLQGLDGAQSHEVVLQKTEGPGTNISTLRIKSEDGEKTYIVKMSFTETIGDLRQHLAQNSMGSEPCLKQTRVSRSLVYVVPKC
uniref:UBX domain-containing protein 11 n=1 Tax=Naja naja TaxID=35670 RepID=A0A8C6XCM4_NAJNA